MILALTALFYILVISDVAEIKLFDVRLPVIFFAINSILILASLIMNRLSIMIRRLNFLRMSSMFSLFVFVPIVGLIFDLYLIAYPDERNSTENK